jgi:hypothetical protein
VLGKFKLDLLQGVISHTFFFPLSLIVATFSCHPRSFPISCTTYSSSLHTRSTAHPWMQPHFGKQGNPKKSSKDPVNKYNLTRVDYDWQTVHRALYRSSWLSSVIYATTEPFLPNTTSEILKSLNLPPLYSVLFAGSRAIIRTPYQCFTF